MFPAKLDGADVLLHTSGGDYGTIRYTTGAVFGHARYLAICQYPDAPEQYYLFTVNERYEVIGDVPYDSIEGCMAALDDGVCWIRRFQREHP